MAPLFKSTFLVLTALFPIVNPLGSAPLFLSLTRYYSGDQRKLLSRRIAINSIALIVASYFVGTHILAFVGISLPVVQVGGGLVLASTGWALLKQKDDDDTKAGRKRDEKDSTAETSSKPARPDPKEGAKSSDSARSKDANKLKEGGNTPGRSPTRA